MQKLHKQLPTCYLHLRNHRDVINRLDLSFNTIVFKAGRFALKKEATSRKCIEKGAP